MSLREGGEPRRELKFLFVVVVVSVWVFNVLDAVVGPVCRAWERGGGGGGWGLHYVPIAGTFFFLLVFLSYFFNLKYTTA